MTEDAAYWSLCPICERIPRRPPVCDTCRAWLANAIADLARLVGELVALDHMSPDVRVAPVADYDDKPGRDARTDSTWRAGRCVPTQASW